MTTSIRRGDVIGLLFKINADYKQPARFSRTDITASSKLVLFFLYGSKDRIASQVDVSLS